MNADIVLSNTEKKKVKYILTM